MHDTFQKANIETTVLVADWSCPAIFQGCFKTSLISNEKLPTFLFFRCQVENKKGENYMCESFFPTKYNFSHLYNEFHLISLEQRTKGIDYAEYILKYALHKTLLEMRINSKQQFASIDKEAMTAMIKRVEPMLQRDGVWHMSDDHIGFAVAMDFDPQEHMGQLALNTLFNFSNSVNFN